MTYTDAQHTTATAVNLGQSPMSIQRGEAVERKAITFNASWTANTYTLRLHHNDGTDGYTDQTLTYGQTASIQSVSRTGYVTFQGTYSPEPIYTNPATNLYLGAGNKLYYPSSAKDINSFRAYFQLNKGLTAGEPSNPNSVRGFSLGFGEGGATRISASLVKSEEVKSGIALTVAASTASPSARGCTSTMERSE